MDTKLKHLSDAPVKVGLPANIPNPIKPEWYAGRHHAALAALVGLSQFGVNHVVLERGAYSALRHWHEEEDEFVYVLSGAPVLIDDNGKHPLRAGDFIGFPAGAANAHHLTNEGDEPAVLLTIGTRKVGREVVHYPDDDFGPGIVTRDANGNRI